MEYNENETANVHKQDQIYFVIYFLNKCPCTCLKQKLINLKSLINTDRDIAKANT